MALPQTAEFLKSLPAVRATTTAVLDAALDGDRLQAWAVHMDRLDAVVDFVAETCELNYPGQPLAAIPYCPLRSSVHERGHG